MILLCHGFALIIVTGEKATDMPAVGGTTLANVDRHIEDGSTDAPDELALGEWRSLEVETSHHTIRGHRFVVLHKMDRTHLLSELAL